MRTGIDSACGIWSGMIRVCVFVGEKYEQAIVGASPKRVIGRWLAWIIRRMDA